MKLATRIRGLGEAALLLVAVVVIPPLPRSWVVALANGLGACAYRVSGSSRRVALANLAVAFGKTQSEDQREALARESFKTFALTTLDLFWFGWFTEHRVRRYVKRDATFSRITDVQPVVAVTAHLGNWEVLAHASRLWGIKAVSVAMPLKNQFADAILNYLRRKLGQGIQPRAGAVRALMKALRQGSSVALLLDQNTLPREGGTFADFYGLPVPVSRAPCLLAQRSARPLIIAYCLHEGAGTYCAYAMLDSQVESYTDDRAATQAVMAQLQGMITRHAGQWLWMYKRWKFIPPGRDAAGYPAYARHAQQSGASDRVENGTSVD